MKRTAFRRKEAPPSQQTGRQWQGGPITPRVAPAPAQPCSRAVLSIPKEAPTQNRAYMAAVRELPCAMCRRWGPSQFCHRDEGKGLAIKTDCREGWPGCPPCHAFVGSTGKMGKAERRAFELRAGHNTRLIVFATGRWPAKLPRWIG